MSKYTPEQVDYLKQKIAASVKQEGECVVWQLCTHGAAPVVNTPRDIGNRNVRVRAFLFDYVWGKKKPSDGRWFPVAKCGNPLCLNEAHNEWESPSEVSKMNMKRTGYHLDPERRAKISESLRKKSLLRDSEALHNELHFYEHQGDDEYDLPANNNRPWTEEEEEFLIANAGYVSVKAMKQILERSVKSIIAKAEKMKLCLEVHTPMNEVMPGLDFLPPGSSTYKTQRGSVVMRVPCSTPGIISRTVHSSFHTTDARIR
jgi:hypothetical protein